MAPMAFCGPHVSTALPLAFSEALPTTTTLACCVRTSLGASGRVFSVEVVAGLGASSGDWRETCAHAARDDSIIAVIRSQRIKSTPPVVLFQPWQGRSYSCLLRCKIRVISPPNSLNRSPIADPPTDEIGRAHV